jgi:predicted amidophosphoribosyltransferase
MPAGTALARDLRTRIARTGAVLVDLVLPAPCAGCGIEGNGQLCDACRAGLAGLLPAFTVPSPPPLGLPPCVALGAYQGPLRGLLLSYKERGAHRLATPLGQGLARAVAAMVGRRYPLGTPTVIIPVPSTAAAIRERHGDHMTRLAGRAVRELGRVGWPAQVSACLSARPKADSSHLSAAERAVAASDAFRARTAAAARVAAAQRAGAAVVIVDDIITTGATIASASAVLLGYGAYADGAATLAATRRQNNSIVRVRATEMGRDMGFSP